MAYHKEYFLKHKEKIHENQRKYRQTHREQKIASQRRLRLKYKKEALCCVCGKPSLYSKSMCFNCYIKHKNAMEKRRAKLKSLGLCISCGKEPVVEGKLNCKKCKERHGVKVNIWAWMGRIKFLRAMGGRCTSCGESDLRVLEVDHLEPYHHRKNGFSWLAITHLIRMSEKMRNKILEEYKQGKIRLLCRNCNRLAALKNMGSELYFQGALKKLNEAKN